LKKFISIRHEFKKTIALALFFTLSGCATATPPVSGQSAMIANQSVKETPPNAAVLQIATGRKQNTPLCVDDQKIGVLSYRSRANLVLAPGVHTITISEPEEPDCAKRATLNSNYYNSFIAAHKIDLTKGKSHLLILYQDKSKKEFTYLEDNFENAPWALQFPIVINHVAPNADLSQSSQSETVSGTQEQLQLEKKVKLSLEDAKKECSDLGFKLKSKDHGNCVIELIQ